MKRGDLPLYLALLLAFAALPLGFDLFHRGGGSREGLVLEAVSDGAVLAREEWGGTRAPREILLRAGGGRNTLLIEPGSARMISADCPGGDCLRMPPLTDARGSIVCLPHRLIVRLRGKGGEGKGDEGDATGLDALTY